jgi:hypothetical protein
MGAHARWWSEYRRNRAQHSSANEKGQPRAPIPLEAGGCMAHRLSDAGPIRVEGRSATMSSEAL